jgi:hypothetical protein
MVSGLTDSFYTNLIPGLPVHRCLALVVVPIVHLGGVGHGGIAVLVMMVVMMMMVMMHHFLLVIIIVVAFGRARACTTGNLEQLLLGQFLSEDILSGCSFF